MDTNDYRKIPRDTRYDPFGDGEIDDYLNWDQPEDDIVGARLAKPLTADGNRRKEEEQKTSKGARIIREDAFPEVDGRRQTADGRQQTADSRRQTADSRWQTADDRLQEEQEEKQESADGLKITRLRSPVSAAPVLEVKNLSVQFGPIVVLRNINITVQRGETVAIIGESGCGKTVLLKTLIGLLTPAEGEVLFDGMDIHTLDEKELTQQRTRYGFVFQQAALFDSMSIFENISFPLRQHTDYGEQEMLGITRQLLAEVGLSDSVLDKKPAELSGGMRKRVGFARALAMEPEIMLYDEPTTGLDPIMSDVINELMLRSKQNHDVSGIVVTHDMVSARKVADRIVMLYPITRLAPHESQILFDGTPREIEHTQDPRVAQFLKGEAGDRFYEK
ncbi:MAG: ABC transporter ATP-binding protein [Planctomycetaceae bacterium]|nr:ABC transporter ATP-binding protein [Planctomycetaceae bacterium]